MREPVVMRIVRSVAAGRPAPSSGADKSANRPRGDRLY